MNLSTQIYSSQCQESGPIDWTNGTLFLPMLFLMFLPLFFPPPLPLPPPPFFIWSILEQGLDRSASIAFTEAREAALVTGFTLRMYFSSTAITRLGQGSSK